MTPKEAVLEYVSAINEHDIEKIFSLMADDHLFMDTYASLVRGKNNMRDGWIGYFEWFPDYLIEATDILADQDTVLLLVLQAAPTGEERTSITTRSGTSPLPGKQL